MVISSSRSLLNSAVQCQTIPIVENRIHFAQVLHTSRTNVILLRHCNIIEIASAI